MMFLFRRKLSCCSYFLILLEDVQAKRFHLFLFSFLLFLPHFAQGKHKNCNGAGSQCAGQGKEPAATNAATKCQTVQPQAAALARVVPASPVVSRPRRDRSARRTAQIENCDAGEDGSGAARGGEAPAWARSPADAAAAAPRPQLPRLTIRRSLMGQAKLMRASSSQT